MNSKPDQDCDSSSTSGSLAMGTLCHPIESNDLFRGLKEIFIRHGDELYRLTITRNGKLILQK